MLMPRLHHVLRMLTLDPGTEGRIGSQPRRALGLLGAPDHGCCVASPRGDPWVSDSPLPRPPKGLDRRRRCHPWQPGALTPCLPRFRCDRCSTTWTPGRGIVGVIDGLVPAGAEIDADVADRKKLLRTIGYKL